MPQAKHLSRAIDARLAPDAHEVILFEEFLVKANVDMIPREYFIKVALSEIVEVGFQVALVESLQPLVMPVLILPGIKFATQFPSAPNYPRQTAIAPAQPAFEFAAFKIVPTQVHAATAQLLLQQRLFLFDLIAPVLRHPLEGRMRVWE